MTSFDHQDHWIYESLKCFHYEDLICTCVEIQPIFQAVANLSHKPPGVDMTKLFFLLGISCLN